MKNALLEREKLARCELMPSTIRLLPFLLCAIRRERIFPFDLGCRLWTMEEGTREREIGGVCVIGQIVSGNYFDRWRLGGEEKI